MPDKSSSGDTKPPQPQEPPEPAEGTPTGVRKQDRYLYEYSGIQEYGGKEPLWLRLVHIGLVVWAIYYAIRYWSSS